MMGLKKMGNILVPVNREESVVGLLPEECKSMANKCQSCGDVCKQKDGHNEIEGQAENLVETLVEIVIFQNVINWRYNQRDDSDCERRCTPETLFECSWVGEVQTNTVETA